MRLSLAVLFASFSRIAAGAAVSPGLETQHPLQGLGSHLSDDRPILNAHLDAEILRILKEFKTPGGVGVAVVHKTPQGTWKLESKGYGNATDGAEVTADTLFAIGSNSKLFDVLATGLLISNETLSPRISWTSKMAAILPGWKLMDPVATSESTILDLMSHRTGLPRHDFMAPLDDDTANVISRLQYLRPSTGFREQLQYNNHMYTVLSHLPRALLNTSFEDYVHDNIFAPLGMDATTYFYADAAKTGNLADGFVRQNANLTEDPFSQGTVRALPYWDQSKKGHVISGAGGVISNAHDMAFWLQMLLMEGKSQSNETVIPAAVIQKVAAGLTVSKAVAQFPELSPVVYGGGQLRGTYRGFEMIEHGGSTPGFKSQVTRFPAQNLGIVVMSNEEELGSNVMEAVKYRIADEAFRLEAIDWTARYRAKIAESVPPPFLPRPANATAPSVSYTALAGTYIHPAYGTLRLCLFSANATPDPACAALSAEVEQNLPGVVDPRVPTLIARWATILTNYMQLTHYSGNTFNLTTLFSTHIKDPTEGWVLQNSGLEAEFETHGVEDIGFAISGVWGPGDDVAPPQGETVQERAEVWFAKS
ncbi:beta-lactamase/transpeptidase-like protein [Mycena rosella]|uniref:Beta-lactamase/transpeptidase-like protein n=1 Tax=Mycena rosella TaxID=1033263 RepID=A0AAD7DAV6_MYCRO|nr:beta-lactamase/transpeptidase-like protein [Mycena rosella]